jgi:signal transduction histidine kinase
MHDLSLYLLEVIENSVRAGATTVATRIVADPRSDRLTISVDDDGPGLPVPPDEAIDPFFTTKPGKKTGLGLSLFRQDAEAAGGGLRVGHSRGLGGVEVEAWMELANIDRPPLGDVAMTLVAMAAANPEVRFVVELASGDERLTLDGDELLRQMPALVALQETVT